ncbi:nucleoporin SEH1 isoform X1 [Halyomorpha halys]|uniref:nucleoporin SEH1 isoform X1 n=1 Tax=Halyomorpha halys TaxID=286706 RepID=UPI0006D4C742|nr:nucleoporin SEH1-like isoform X1 [Halyomorpha halys]
MLFSPPKSISSEHKDVIHDVAFDHYGRRMATCSSDQFVMVWDKEQGDDNWKKSAEWKAHSGSVWKVAWAHPEFGQVLATCSFDRTAAVWEEIVGESYNIIGQKHWARRTNLVDSRTSVMDVKFAPKSLGLLLATCSADGVIRIYEAPDVMNLAQWTLQQEVPCKYQASCISWNPSYTRERRCTKYFKLNNSDKKEGEMKIHDLDNGYANYPFMVEDPDSYIVVPQVPMLAVGFDDQNCGANNRVVILQNITRLRRWNKTECSTSVTDHCTSSVTDPVHDLAFAPRLGRSYDLLAVATKDIKLYILCQIMNSSFATVKFKLHLAANFEGHNSTVWRISWNSVGSILVSSGDDRCVRLWKQCPVGPHDKSEDERGVSSPAKSLDSAQGQGRKYHWKCVGVIKAEGLNI